jgi:hypothetical protein
MITGCSRDSQTTVEAPLADYVRPSEEVRGTDTVTGDCSVKEGRMPSNSEDLGISYC